MNYAHNLRYSGLDTISLISHELSSALMSVTKKNMEPETQRNLHIVLADDDDDDLDLFREVIAETVPGISITTVSNGAELMKMLNSSNSLKPDMVFLDLNMPCKNGKECLRDIRSNDTLKNIPVVIYSTSSNQKEIENAYNSGANLYVTKPNTFTDLEEIVKKIFSMDRANFSGQRKRERFVLK